MLWTRVHGEAFENYFSWFKWTSWKFLKMQTMLKVSRKEAEMDLLPFLRFWHKKRSNSNPFFLSLNVSSLRKRATSFIYQGIRAQTKVTPKVLLPSALKITSQPPTQSSSLPFSQMVFLPMSTGMRYLTEKVIRIY